MADLCAVAVVSPAGRRRGRGRGSCVRRRRRLGEKLAGVFVASAASAVGAAHARSSVEARHRLGKGFEEALHWREAELGTRGGLARGREGKWLIGFLV